MKSLVVTLLALTLVRPVPLCAQDEATPSVTLHVAALQGDVSAVRQHIAAGSDLDAKDAYGSTPLIVAAAFGRPDVAKLLIAAGADLDVRNNDGGTALHTAAFLCRPEIVRDLLDGGANKYLRDHFGNTPLESVASPFEDVEAIYDQFGQALAPLGLVLDYEQIRATRPKIAEMLRPRADELERVDYTPRPGGSWTSTSTSPRSAAS